MASPYRQVTGRDVAALLNPRPVVIIGAHDGNETGFATVAWITPISHDPALLAFALRAQSHTMGLIRATGAFSVSVLDARASDSIEAAAYCGNGSGYREDKGKGLAHQLVKPQSTDGNESADGELPVVAGALSWLACKVEDIREAGDHLLTTALVTEAHTRCESDGKGRISSVDALLCIQHDTFAIAGTAALRFKETSSGATPSAKAAHRRSAP